MSARRCALAIPFLLVAVSLAEQLTVQQLAVKLAESSADERRRLIEANPDSITPELAKAIHDRSTELSGQGKFQPALELELLALSLAQRVGDRALEETCVHGAGFCHSQLGHLEEAAACFRRAAAIGEERNDPVRVARHYIDLSTTLSNLGDYAGGLREANKALELAVVAHAAPEEARARNALGKAHYNVGRFAEALAQYQKALDIAEREHLDAGISYLANNIGNLYADQGNREMALRYLERSRTIKEKRKDPELLTTLALLADLYHDLGRDDEARRTAERSLGMVLEQGRKAKIAAPVRVLAKIELDSGRYAAAVERLVAADRVALETKAPHVHAEFLGDIAEVRLAAGEPQKALAAALESVAAARPLGDEQMSGRALDLAGEAAFRAGKLGLARACSLEAVECYERQRDETAGGDEDRALFFEGMLAPYYRIARMDASAGRVSSAFEFAERAKARVLAETLVSGHTTITRFMTADEQTREAKLRAAASRAPAGKQRDSARLDYRAFLTSLYARHPELRVARARSRTLSAREASAAIPDRDTLLLQFLVTPAETLLFTLTRDRAPRVARIRVSDRQLRREVESYRDRIAAKDLDYQDASRALYARLLAPVQAEMAGRAGLIILPDGPLWQLPFQTLLEPDGRFLAETFRVSYAASATVFAALAARSKRSAGAPRLLALAHGLPEAESEARALGDLYGPAATVFTGAAAREAVFKAQAPAFDILHIASHGVLDNASPMYSFVTLAAGAAEDGRLEAAELMNMALRARLVVLSACDTARGRIGAGEGVIGLTWALAVAGVPTTVASGWKVDSGATASLMVAFHRGLRGGLTPAGALQQASLALLGQPAWRHPFYWGSFAVFGPGLATTP